MAGRIAWTRLAALGKKYRFAVLVILAGVLVMLLPTGGKQKTTTNETQRGEAFSVEETERRMEEVLGQIQGTGKLRLMLTLKSASSLQLAEDVDTNGTDSRSEPLTVNRGSGYQDVVVTGQLYPEFQGAVVVCEGADKSAVRLAIAEAVSALTGLRADKISIVKWQS